MNVSDLPNGGRNLRVYTYDPAGSQYGPIYAGLNTVCPDPTPGHQWIYNSGHFDIGLGIPCSQPDPQGFCDIGSLSAYASSRGETLVMVSRSDLTTLCAYRQTAGPSPAVGGTVVQGGVNPTTIVSAPGTTTGGPGIVGGYIPPPGTPIDQGGVPSGGSVGVTGASAGPLTAIYRFILNDPNNPAGPWSTGANRAGCSKLNTMNCDPQAFPSLSAAVQYAQAHGEIPYRVYSANEVWDLISGRIGLDSSRILGQGISMSTLAILGLGLWFLSGR